MFFWGGGGGGGGFCPVWLSYVLLDPLGVIASGALLIAISEADVGPVCEALAGAGIVVAPIAHALPPEHGLYMRAGKSVQPLPRYDQDEIARLF